VEKAFGSKQQLAPTIIVKCIKCGGLMLAATTQKTKNCPYCGAHVNLEKAQKVAAAKNAMDASEILRRLKAEQGFTNER
jgi:hypothetical protein